MADAIAASVDNAFDIEWAPRWVKPGDAHYWSEPSNELPSGEIHFAECLECDWVSGHNPTRREAEQKFGRHKQREHRATV